MYFTTLYSFCSSWQLAKHAGCEVAQGSSGSMGGDFIQPAAHLDWKLQCSKSAVGASKGLSAD